MFQINYNSSSFTIEAKAVGWHLAMDAPAIPPKLPPTIAAIFTSLSFTLKAITTGVITAISVMKEPTTVDKTSEKITQKLLFIIIII